MTHNELVEQLVVYAAGGGQAADELMQRHLATCEDCSSWLDAYELLRHGSGCAFQAPSRLLAELAADPRRIDHDQRERLLEHLELCGACRREFEMTQNALGRARRTPAPIGRMSPRRRLAGAVSPVRAALAAGVLLALLLGGAWLVGQLPGDRPDGVPARQTILGYRLIEDDRSVLIVNTTVAAGADVTVKSANTVALGEGFVVDSGASFKVEVAASPPARQTRTEEKR